MGTFLRAVNRRAWPMALAAWTWLLRFRAAGSPARPSDWLIHLATLWLVVVLISMELSWQVKSARLGAPAWHYAMSALPARWRCSWCARSWLWPVSAWPEALRALACGARDLLWLWSLGRECGATPGPILALSTDRQPARLARSWHPTGGRINGVPASRRAAALARTRPDAAHLAGLAFALFAGVTTVLLRVIHHYLGIDYQLDELISTVVQSALSIFWGLVALTSMVAGTRKGWRFVWFAGAALLGVVLAKMFLVDLSRTGTIARIVSFIGVGVLMLIIGRFSPVPPAAAEESGSPRRLGAQEAG
jgi:hypothetical protein